MKISISRLHWPITTLGPGQRVGVWFQGCSIRCPGCVSRDTWDADTGLVDLGVATASLRRFAAAADGLTVSGGEPFDQPEALAALLTDWRSVSATSVFVFSGHRWPEIAPWLAEHPGLIDAIITGPYVAQELQTLALRGSDNQELHLLTERGEEFKTFDRLASADDRRLDAMFDDDGQVWFAGVPARGDLGRLRRALATAGHQVATSDRADVAR